MSALLLTAIIAGVVLGVMFLAAMSRYKKCQPNEILVKYGRVGGDTQHVKAIHGGATFVWPLIQDYDYLDLTPMTIDIDLKGALTKQNIRAHIPCRFTIAISTDPQGMNKAAERLLDMDQEQIEELARDIIFGQLRATVATMSIEEINGEREVFEEKVTLSIESELRKVGLSFINVNIADVQDDSGYLHALGQRAAAEAVQNARIAVAEQERLGTIGATKAKQEQLIAVAESTAATQTGENAAAVKAAESLAQRQIAEAEAQARAEQAAAIATANAQEAAYLAQQRQEEARAKLEHARLHAKEVVAAEIALAQRRLAAEAAQVEEVTTGEAQAQARLAALHAEAQGAYEMLHQKALGFAEIVQACNGSAEQAAMMLIVEQLPAIVKEQAAAIANIDFGKVVVYDSGGTTADFLSGLVKGLPALHEMARAAGMQLPALLGTSDNHHAVAAKE